MKMSKILCPVDFSEHSQAALEVAATLALANGAELILLHSFDVAMTYADDLYSDVSGDLSAVLRKRLDKMAVPEPSLRTRRLLVEGDAGTAILDVARDEKADMIILATHGRTGLTRLLMGSVAEHVVRHATCPVVTLKSETDSPAAS